MNDSGQPRTGATDSEHPPDLDPLDDSVDAPSSDEETATERTRDAAAPTAGIDKASGDQAYEDDPDQNPPLPDWGPTDGVHGVDGTDPNK